MFGFVNNALENLVIRKYGFEKWKEVLLSAGVDLEDHHFLQSFLYDDYDTFALVDAACTVLDVTSVELMEQFGDQFFKWCQESGYDQLLKLLGRTLGEFLASLDALHDHLQLTYPGMQAPSFRIEEHPENPNGLYLHYYSVRVGLQHIVRGVILTVARSIFELEIDMEIIETSQISQAQFHAVFSIVPVGDGQSPIWCSSAATLGSVLNASDMLPSDTDNVLSKSAFCQLFPFHILFDRNLVIKQMGDSLRRLLPEKMCNSDKVTLSSAMILERPHLNMTFESILRHIHTVFVMRVRHSRKGFLPPKLKGQMTYLPQIDSIMYISSPRVRRLKELEEHGLYLSDIPMHDATREIVMTSESTQAHLAMVMKLEQTTDELLESKNALTLEKFRTDALLHSILPKSVAKQILTHREVIPEWYKEVTVLFSDICGFTSICGKCTPIDVISMLNELYTLFDYLTTLNEVYKVETIGDAYMVVGGLPDRCNDHADRVALFAIDMMHACSKVKRPDKPDETIQIRIGFHSGEVMAGVVGTKTPRYCLFGDCVNISSRTESNGHPGRINLSNDAYLKLNPDDYILENRGDVEFKGRADKMHCWFLDGHKTKKPRDVTIQEARKISSLFETMAMQREIEQTVALSPPVSNNPTPKTSSAADPETRISRSTDDTDDGASPRRRRSSGSVPPMESLSSVYSRDGCNDSADRYAGDISPVRRLSDARSLGRRGTCPLMSGNTAPSMQLDARPVSELRMPGTQRVRRVSTTARQQRSKSDPVEPDISSFDQVLLERHGCAMATVPTATSARASRMASQTIMEPGLPAVSSTVTDNASAAESSSSASSSASTSPSVSTVAAPNEPLLMPMSPEAPLPAWVMWYMAGSTSACIALASLMIYQQLRR